MFFKKFNIFKRKKREQIAEPLKDGLSKINVVFKDDSVAKTVLTKHDMKSLKKDDYRNKKITEICENITHAQNRIKSSIEEFDNVKNRLNDIEKIRNANIERKKKIIHISENIENLGNERNKYQKSQDTLELDTNHYLILEKNETVMVNEIKKLEGYEKEYLSIRSDLHKLEGERGTLTFERTKLLTQKSLLKYYVRLLIIVSILLFGMFGVLAYLGKLDSYVPVLITVAFISLNTIYVINSIRNNLSKLEANRLKENKLIGLFNKVKIKYVNSVKVVEYVHRKFDVHNCKELKLMWERYLKEKDRKYRFDQIAKLIGIQNESLDFELDKLELEDKSTWKNHLNVFTDSTALDMFEQKFMLDRDSIKRTIEQNKRIVTSGMKDIKTIINTHEEYKNEIIDIMKESKLFI